jgi:hypothetical protein
VGGALGRAEPASKSGIWIDFQVPRDARPGAYDGTVEVLGNGRTAAQFQLALQVLPAELPDPAGYHCYLNILVDPSSVARFNKIPLWSGEHWRQMDNYVRDLAQHGQKTITAFIVEDPWNSVTGFPVRSLVDQRYGGEWDGSGDLAFDFTQFDRFVRMCLQAGISDHIEACRRSYDPISITRWPHTPIPWLGRRDVSG